jgi:hypothetical protein
MNMGSRSSNIIADLKAGISGMRQEVSLLKQETSGWIQSLTSGSSKLGSFGGGGGAGSTLVAPNPTFSSAPPVVPASEANANQVAANPSSSLVPSQFGSRSGSDLTSYVSQHSGSGNLYMPSIDSGAGGSGWGGGGGGNGSSTGGTSGGYNYGGGNNTDAYNSKFNNSGGTFGSNFIQNIAGNALSTFKANPLGTALYGAGLAANFIPSTADVVQSNLSLQRASFFGGQGYAGAQAQNTTTNAAATLGGADPSMDTMNAMLAAQSYGVAGAQNFSSILGGVANMSNLIPGAGMEGTMRAYGAMQQGSSVNMLKGIGIQLRGEDGTMKPPDQVIDDIWKKICRDYAQAYGSSAKAPSLKEVQIGLQPGNSLDSMLNTYFGSDPILKQMVTNGLIFKATSSGGESAAQQAATGGSAITKDSVLNAGGTTKSVLGFSTRNAAASDLLSAISTDTAGFDKANTMITGLITGLGTTVANSLTLFVKQFTDTVLSAAGGAPGEILTGLAGLAGTRAGGGPVDKSKSYLVGEKGPEVFVPTTNGVIVSNSDLKDAASNTPGTGGVSNNTYNFTVNVPNANTPEVIAALKNLMFELETNQKVSYS